MSTVRPLSVRAKAAATRDRIPSANPDPNDAHSAWIASLTQHMTVAFGEPAEHIEGLSTVSHSEHRTAFRCGDLILADVFVCTREHDADGNLLAQPDGYAAYAYAHVADGAVQWQLFDEGKHEPDLAALGRALKRGRVTDPDAVLATS